VLNAQGSTSWPYDDGRPAWWPGPSPGVAIEPPWTHQQVLDRELVPRFQALTASHGIATDAWPSSSIAKPTEKPAATRDLALR